MSIYDRILAQARELERTHWERDEARTRAFFASHPENRQAIIATLEDGSVVRSKTALVDVEARCGAGWFDRCVSKPRRDERIWWVMPRADADTADEPCGALVNVNEYAEKWAKALKQDVTGRQYVAVGKRQKRESARASTQVKGAGGIITHDWQQEVRRGERDRKALVCGAHLAGID